MFDLLSVLILMHESILEVGKMYMNVSHRNMKSYSGWLMLINVAHRNLPGT